MARIENVLFDLGNVLVGIHWNFTFDLLSGMLSPELAELMRSNPTAFKNLFLEPSIQLETGEIDFPQFHHEIQRRLNLDLSTEDFRKIWCSMFRLNAETVGLGKCLSRHYNTWLVSNTSEVHYEFIVEAFPSVTFYKDAALSYKMGVMKPARDYYAQAIRRFGIDPSASVFIDDLEENVTGAIQAGMHGIVFRGFDSLVRDLNDLGVDVHCESGATYERDQRF